MGEPLTWKNFFDADALPAPSVEAFLGALDLRAVHFQIAKDILSECVRLHPSNLRIVSASFEKLLTLLSHLTEEDTEAWCGRAGAVLDGGDPLLAVACFDFLAAYSKAKPALFKGVDAFIARTQLYATNKTVLLSALPLFVNVISMNGVSNDLDSVAATMDYFAALLAFSVDSPAVVQSACFLLGMIKEKHDDLAVRSDVVSSLVAAMGRNSDEFGCVRTCLRTVTSLAPLPLVLADPSTAAAFGRAFLQAFLLFEENCDGASMALVLQLTTHLLRTEGALRQALRRDCATLRPLLARYSDEEALEDLMLADSEAFLEARDALAAEIDALLGEPEAEQPELEEEPQAAAEEAPPSPPSAVSTFAIEHVSSDTHTLSPEAHYDSAGALEAAVVGVSEDKVLEMMHLLRHFQDHASTSFHRAELMHGLFLDASRKVEALLRENVALNKEVSALRTQLAHASPARPVQRAVSRSARPAADAANNSSLQESHAPLNLSTSTLELPSASGLTGAFFVLEKERKVLQYVFDAYATRGALSGDAVLSLMRDFGVSPALVSPHDLMGLFDASTNSPGKLLDFAAVRALLFICVNSVRLTFDVRT